MGTMRYWPRGSATHCGPVYLTVSSVIAENAIWDAAYADGTDVTWSTPFAVADPDTVARAIKAKAEDDDSSSEAEDDLAFVEPVVHVWRPDFGNTKALS
jgi:hypothetical protein